MFKRLFNSPKSAYAVVRHETAPYAPERKQFLEHCAKRGYSRICLTRTAATLLRIVHELKDYPDLKVTEDEIQTASRRTIRRSGVFRKISDVHEFRRTFVAIAKSWLRFLGRFQEPDIKPAPFADLLDDFVKWMHVERGLSPATVRNRRWHIGCFLSWFGEQSRPISSLCLADVDAYQAFCSDRNLSRISIKIHTNAIRVFLRHAGSRKWCSSSIADEIQGPCIYAQEEIPSGPSWADVRRLVSSLGSEKRAHIRDRAIILLFAVYGLRVSEVARLRLEDIDWEHDQIIVRRYKQRRSQLYPLLPVVGNAIVHYLSVVRPKCGHRELFITLLAPWKPMSPAAFYQVVTGRMRILGMNELPHYGPHALRHACAAHLLSEGFTLKEIGDHLGHTSPSSTRIYTKVDLAGLREVAAFDLGGVL
jgi:integrase/recombinase XerD